MIRKFGRILVLPNFFAEGKRKEQVEQTAKRYKTISESTAFMLLLTLLSGYLNAYTYATRGGIFANMHTGNMTKLGIGLASGNVAGSWQYLAPILAAVLGVVLVAAYRDGTGFDALRRLCSYGSGEESTAEAQYDYDASDSNRFAVLGDSLVVLSDTKLQVLARGGEEIWSTSVRMSAPALETGGGRAVAYDVGGTELYVVDEGGEILTLTAPEDAPYFSARLNEDGWLAVTTELPGYKGGVTAYNSQGTEVFSLTASDRFVIDARVTDDDNTLAVVTLGQENSVFVSNMVLYSLETAGNVDPAADYDVTDGLVAAVGEQDGQLVTVSDTCLTYASPAGEVRATYSYAGSYLREYDLHGDGFTALLLNRYKSGGVGRLVTVDTDGQEIAALDVNEEILSISAAGRYLAVLYMDSVVIYTEELEIYAQLEGTDYARSVLMRQDGSALLLAAESAHLFLP